jgi:hypothetical protein
VVELIETSADTSGVGSAGDLKAVNQRIDDIVAFQKRRPIWYRDTSLVISVAALFITIVTTVVSWYRANQQDVNAAKLQLSNVLQQTATLKTGALEYVVKYKDQGQLFTQLMSDVNERNIQLANEAYSLVKFLGRSASATQLTAVASNLMASDMSLLSEGLMVDAVDRANNSVEYVAANRLLGLLYFKLGRQDDGNAALQKAADAFKIYSSEAISTDYVNLTQAYTFALWTQATQNSNCPLAKQRLQTAMGYWAKLPPPTQQITSMPAQFICP